MLLDASRSQLVLVDYQVRLAHAIHEFQEVQDNALRLATLAQWLQVPSIATEHCPDKLGPNVDVLKALCQRTLVKTHFSAVADGLLDWLQTDLQSGRNQVLIAGCEAHVCLMQTALELLQEGLEVWVVADACSSRRPENRKAGLQRLAASGARIVTTEMVGFEWLRHAGHEFFRDYQALIR